MCRDGHMAVHHNAFSAHRSQRRLRNSEQLWSSYRNRSPKTSAVQLLRTKSFILLHPAHTINHRGYSIIGMYIFLWSCPYHARSAALCKYFLLRILMSFETVLTPFLSLCCVYVVVIVFLNQIFRETHCCFRAGICLNVHGRPEEWRGILEHFFSVKVGNIFCIVLRSSLGTSFAISRVVPKKKK